MPTNLTVIIELSVIALFGMAFARRKISSARQVARIRVPVEDPQKRIRRINR